MKLRIFLGGLVLLAVIGAALFTTRPAHPAAAIKVVDSSGRPVANAVIRPDGYRPKGGGGHYFWNTNLVPDTPQITDENGVVTVLYPHFAHERIEVGEISFSVDHPDFCPERPFRVVDSSPPPSAGFLKKWIHPLLQLVRVAPASRADPVVLERGAPVRVSAQVTNGAAPVSPLYAEVPGVWMARTNFWQPMPDGTLFTKRIRPGPVTLRVAAWIDDRFWFSDAQSFVAVTNRTNEVRALLQPGAGVTGELDEAVPRPVTNGFVIAEVWSPTNAPGGQALVWHTWSSIRADGTFAFEPLPTGRLEVIAVCDGFVSRNHRGSSSGIRTGQQWLLEAAPRAIVVQMEAAGRLVVNVVDDEKRPVEKAELLAWPNCNWGNHSSTIFPGARYRSSEVLRGNGTVDWNRARFRNFQARSDAGGVAVLNDVPAGSLGYSVTHDLYVMPVRNQVRSGSAVIVSSETVTQTVVLTKRGKDVLMN